MIRQPCLLPGVCPLLLLIFLGGKSSLWLSLFPPSALLERDFIGMVLLIIFTLFLQPVLSSRFKSFSQKYLPMIIHPIRPSTLLLAPPISEECRAQVIKPHQAALAAPLTRLRPRDVSMKSRPSLTPQLCLQSYTKIVTLLSNSETISRERKPHFVDSSEGLRLILLLQHHEPISILTAKVWSTRSIFPTVLMIMLLYDPRPYNLKEN